MVFRTTQSYADVLSAAERRLGELVLQDELLSPEELEMAQQESTQSGARLGYILVAKGFLSEADVAGVLSREYHLPTIGLEEVEVDERAVAMIPPDFASKHALLPIKRTGRVLTVALADPSDPTLVDVLKFITSFDIEPLVASEYALRSLIEKHYDVTTAKLGELLDELEEMEVELVEAEDPDDVSAAQLRAQVEDAPVVRLINGVLTDAVKRGASDIHIEPYEKQLRVRYRVDGALQEIMLPPVRMQAAVISRVKILADLNIAERRIPQDGRIKMKLGNKLIDFRVSTLPCLFGEKVVLRILDKGNLTLDLEEFGMEKKAERDMLSAIRNPYGIVLVTGPTGSGKTTTLYAALTRINTDEVNIMTAEDPVEYNLRGINQVQVRPEIGLSFASALRAFLRQDPNIIMVGEIRDLETAGIAVKASLTGHLVLSTVHTNDAGSTITRLVDMGVEPFNVAAAVNLITAQRLVRRICEGCKAETTYMPEVLEAAGLPEHELSRITFFKGEGCDACGGSGYRGRQGLYEVMEITAELRRMVLQGASAAELKAEAIKDGMLTLRDDGLIKLKRGITTLDEVLKETAL